ncbi:MAG TPA: glycosyltransferase [Pyrinomonadaceae bacterium]|jgi:glycosyltransferase involved in cell wall biosynthesis|nr:glycosyltransferase [Pyrinomonadaceae bacterium]
MNAINPRVSVLLPVYQGERYLREAVDSILNQTFNDFEFIIIDDASTDGSAEIIGSYGDPRIRFVRNDANLGLTATLNAGLELARGEYVARMDQDDVSLPERLSRQVAFMDSRPELAASGTWAKEIDEGGNVTGERRMTVGEQMEYGYWWPCPIIHPSAFIRRSLLGGIRYEPDVGHAADYDLWLALKKNHALDNLPEFLILYRVHGGSTSIMHTDAQFRSVHQSLCRRTGLAASYEEFLELTGVTRRLGRLRRALLRGRLARATGKPLGRHANEELSLLGDWLRAVVRYRVVGARLTRNLGRAWRRLRPL